MKSTKSSRDRKRLREHRESLSSEDEVKYKKFYNNKTEIYNEFDNIKKSTNISPFKHIRISDDGDNIHDSYNSNNNNSISNNDVIHYDQNNEEEVNEISIGEINNIIITEENQEQDEKLNEEDLTSNVNEYTENENYIDSNNLYNYTVTENNSKTYEKFNNNLTTSKSGQSLKQEITDIDSQIKYLKSKLKYMIDGNLKWE